MFLAWRSCANPEFAHALPSIMFVVLIGDLLKRNALHLQAWSGITSKPFTDSKAPQTNITGTCLRQCADHLHLALCALSTVPPCS